jgi:hypothetical protein
MHPLYHVVVPMTTCSSTERRRTLIAMDSTAAPGPDIGAAVTTLLMLAAHSDGGAPVSAEAALEALALLGQVRDELAAAEPALITAARRAGASWQAIAPALGVASRQAAERRYLRGAPSTTDRKGDTRDARVQAERDHRAGTRALSRWADDHTADLRRLAGQISALSDLPTGDADLHRLHEALADPDARALPALLATVRHHLDGRADHADLVGQIDRVTASTTEVLRRTQEHRDQR